MVKREKWVSDYDMNEVRCLNCLKRFEVQPQAEEAACPNCEIRYRISWPRPDQPKIRGSV